MERRSARRKWVLAAALALVPAGCGDEPAPAKTTSTFTIVDAEFLKRCDLAPQSDAGGFPAGLLPDQDTVVTTDRVAIVDGKLADVFAQLRSRPGFAVRDSELETLDAELELEGPDGEVSLQLDLAPDCARATRVTLR
jgi:hypothetical protein